VADAHMTRHLPANNSHGPIDRGFNLQYSIDGFTFFTPPDSTIIL